MLEAVEAVGGVCRGRDDTREIGLGGKFNLRLLMMGKQLSAIELL